MPAHSSSISMSAVETEGRSSAISNARGVPPHRFHWSNLVIRFTETGDMRSLKSLQPETDLDS